MKISKNKSFSKYLKILFSSFLLSLTAIISFFTLFYVYKEAEEKGMGPEIKERKENISFIPYEIFDVMSYLI